MNISRKYLINRSKDNIPIINSINNTIKNFDLVRKNENLQNEIIFNDSINVDRLTIGAELFNSIKCVLCNFLCIDPVYMFCCDALVCRECISKFKQKTSECPSCNQSEAKFDSLTKFMTRMMNTIRIKCKFNDDNGQMCKEKSIAYNNLKEHENFCEFNPNCLKKCDKCFQHFEKTKIESHNCLTVLIGCYQKLKEELDELKLNEELENNDELIVMLKQSLKIHSHPMLKTAKFTAWKCSTCNQKLASSEPSTRCYQCELDICSNCFELSTKEGDSSVHGHSLVFKMPNGSWTCNLCRISYPYRTFSFRCDTCDFDQCYKCRYK